MVKPTHIWCTACKGIKSGGMRSKPGELHLEHAVRNGPNRKTKKVPTLEFISNTCQEDRSCLAAQHKSSLSKTAQSWSCKANGMAHAGTLLHSPSEWHGSRTLTVIDMHQLSLSVHQPLWVGTEKKDTETAAAAARFYCFLAKVTIC